MKAEELARLIEQKIDRWRDLEKRHFGEEADLTLVVLRGHLLIERQLRAIIRSRCPFPEHIESVRLQFHQVVALARSLLPAPFGGDLWAVVGLVSRVRNGLAHELEPTKIGEWLAEACRLAEPMNLVLPEKLNESDREVAVFRGIIGAAMGTLEAAEVLAAAAPVPKGGSLNALGVDIKWDPLESTCRHASLSIL